MIQTIAVMFLGILVGYSLITKYINTLLSVKDAVNPVYSKFNLLNISNRLNNMVNKHDNDDKYDAEIGRLGDQYKFMIQTNIDVVSGKKTIEEAWEEEDKLKDKGIFKTNSYL